MDMDLDDIQLHAEDAMSKARNYLADELRGVRTGRASTGLVEYIKVDYYGSMTELRQLALITTPEPTQLLIKPFDASSTGAITKAIQNAGLGLNPVSEGKQVRLSMPPLSGDRRKQLIASVKQMGEQAKIAVRNARRDANKHIDQVGKDKDSGVSEDDVDRAKQEVQDLLKSHEAAIDKMLDQKVKEIEEV